MSVFSARVVADSVALVLATVSSRTPTPRRRVGPLDADRGHVARAVSATGP